MNRATSKHCPTIFWQSVLFLAILLLTTTCKTKRSLGKDPTDQNYTELLSAVQQRDFTFQTLSARLYVNIETKKKSLGSRVELKMIRDSLIQLSVQPFFGFEAFRAEFATDSIRVLDRMNKHFLTESYANLKTLFPIELNFYNLQSLLTNQLFLPGKRELTKEDYEHFSPAPALQALTSVETTSKDGLRYTFSIDPTTANIHHLYAKQQTGSYALAWDYADFAAYDQSLFPETMDITLTKDAKNIGSMRIKASRIQRNIPLRTDFHISSKYKRMQLRKDFLHGKN